MVCPICNGTQLIPFKRKDGTIVPDTWLYCECKVDEPEQYHELRPEDFDFPCSETFRSYYTERYGYPWERSGGLYQPEEQPAAPAPQPETWDKRQQYQLDQTRAELNHVKGKLAELTAKIDKPRAAQQPKKTGYKGLVIK